MAPRDHSTPTSLGLVVPRELLCWVGGRWLAHSAISPMHGVCALPNMSKRAPLALRSSAHRNTLVASTRVGLVACVEQVVPRTLRRASGVERGSMRLCARSPCGPTSVYPGREAGRTQASRRSQWLAAAAGPGSASTLLPIARQHPPLAQVSCRFLCTCVCPCMSWMCLALERLRQRSHFGPRFAGARHLSTSAFSCTIARVCRLASCARRALSDHCSALPLSQLFAATIAGSWHVSVVELAGWSTFWVERTACRDHGSMRSCTVVDDRPQ